MSAVPVAMVLVPQAVVVGHADVGVACIVSELVFQFADDAGDTACCFKIASSGAKVFAGGQCYCHEGNEDDFFIFQCFRF